MSEEEGFMLFWAGLSITASMITAKLKSRVTFFTTDSIEKSRCWIKIVGKNS